MKEQNDELKTRVLTGALIAIVLALVVIFSHLSWVLNTTMGYLCLQAIFALYRATDLKENKPVYYISYVVAFAVAILPIYSWLLKRFPPHHFYNKNDLLMGVLWINK